MPGLPAKVSQPEPGPPSTPAAGLPATKGNVERPPPDSAENMTSLASADPRQLSSQIKTLRLHDLNQAIDFGEACARAHPKAAGIWCSLGTTYAQARQDREATRCFDAGLVAEP